MQRVFIPGSEWLYFKIYTGFKSADLILTDYLLPMATKLMNDKIIDNFFFIRYGDPKFHIRFRLHVREVANYGAIFKLFSETFYNLVINNQVSKIQCDTYVREIERYGTDYLEEIEKIFSIDSHRILNILKLAKDSINADDNRWQLAMILLDDMMSSFNYSTEQKFQLTKLMTGNYKQEFGFVNSASMKQLNDKYRSKRKDIEITLNDKNTVLDMYKDELNTRKKEIEDVAKTISCEDSLIKDLLYSLNHMTINRLFRSKNRLHELVICDFLQRFYDSEIAKTKYSKYIEKAL